MRGPLNKGGPDKFLWYWVTPCHVARHSSPAHRNTVCCGVMSRDIPVSVKNTFLLGEPLPCNPCGNCYPAPDLVLLKPIFIIVLVLFLGGVSSSQTPVCFCCFCEQLRTWRRRARVPNRRVPGTAVVFASFQKDQDRQGHVCMYVCMYILRLLLFALSRWLFVALWMLLVLLLVVVVVVDRSAAIPRSQLSREHVATCGKVCQHVATRARSTPNMAKCWGIFKNKTPEEMIIIGLNKIFTSMGKPKQLNSDEWPFCENPLCPEPAWKPATLVALRRYVCK